MIKQLINLANALDDIGLTKAADQLDELIKKFADITQQRETYGQQLKSNLVQMGYDVDEVNVQGDFDSGAGNIHIWTKAPCAKLAQLVYNKFRGQLWNLGFRIIVCENDTPGKHDYARINVTQ